MKQIKLQIDQSPPSINNYYRSTRGGQRYISAKGREFKDYVEWHLLKLKNQAKFAGLWNARVRVDYEFNFKGKRKRDGSNYIKVMEDCLQGNVFENDEQVDEGGWKRNYMATHDHIIITITQL